MTTLLIKHSLKVNRLYDEWERRASMEEEQMDATKAFTDTCNGLEMALADLENRLKRACKTPLPRDNDILQDLQASHVQFQYQLQKQQSEINNVRVQYNVLNILWIH